MGADRANMVYHIENQIADSDGKIAGKNFEREVEVSSAELLALATTAKELVPVPGTNQIIEFISVVIKHIAGTAYAEPSAPDEMVVQYSGGQDVCAEIDVTGFLTVTTDEIRIARANLASTVDIEALKNTSLVLFNSGGNWTTGTGSLNVRISYRIHDFN